MTAEKMMELADELDSYNNESRVLPRATRVMQKAAMALRSLAVGAGAREALPRWRHKKRGTTYSEIGRGKMQAFESALDMEPVVIYRSDADGSLWVRPTNEFEDGRFEAALPSDPVRRTTQPIQRDSTARLDSGEVRQQGSET